MDKLAKPVQDLILRKRNEKELWLFNRRELKMKEALKKYKGYKLEEPENPYIEKLEQDGPPPRDSFAQVEDVIGRESMHNIPRVLGNYDEVRPIHA